MEQEFSEKEGALLLKLARQGIKDQLDGLDKKDITKGADLPECIVNKSRGTFVSLHKKGKLRGCIGNIEPVKTVAQGVYDNAKHAAFDDSRFDALSEDELQDTRIEVSILTCPKEVEHDDGSDLVSKIRPGIDGVIIKKSYQSATFLPQVWKQLKTPEDFLRHLCLKAGLPSGEWKNGTLAVSVYQVESFEDDCR